MAGRALVGDEIRLLLCSLEVGRNGLFNEMGKMGSGLQSTMRITDGRYKGRQLGQETPQLSACEYVAMKNGSGTQAARIGAIQFLHLVDGRGGGFDGKSWRARLTRGCPDGTGRQSEETGKPRYDAAWAGFARLENAQRFRSVGICFF